MSKIRSIRKVRCKETWSRYPKEIEFVQLFVAEMIDGTRFYTTKGGTQIFGTEEELNGETDISNVHDFQTISVAGGVKDEEQFRKIVESEAVIDQLV
jgi:heptaprenylglyceryl phosphate synthase